MPRQKLSEHRAKTILHAALGRPYTGLAIDAASLVWRKHLAALSPAKTYVVKVDEGVKGRFKKGLVRLDRTTRQLPDDITALADRGYHHFLIEEYQDHPATAEYYLAIQRQRAGNQVTFSVRGGVDVEQNADAMQHARLHPSSATNIERTLSLPPGMLQRLGQAFDDNHFALLEINPLVVTQGAPQLLDAAVEVDDEAASLVDGRWTAADLRDAQAKTPEELAVEELAAQSQASFRLKVLNPDGAIFLLLSGGGASIVLADEVHNQGHGHELGNYGEYSGNPNTAETYRYTKQVISLMLGSTAPRKVLVIGGGVANFTDVRATFRGVIQALEEAKTELQRQHVKVFVRRGGPHEAEGLATMHAFLERAGLLGLTAGPELTLSEIIPRALVTLETT